MTNSEAIDLLDNLLGVVEDNHGSDYDNAIHMAIDALREQHRQFTVTEFDGSGCSFMAQPWRGEEDG